MNHLILGYVRVTCMAAMYCMGMLMREHSTGKQLEDDKRDYEQLWSAIKLLDKETDELYNK